MDLDSLVTRNPQVVARELPAPDGAVLLHLDTGAYHGLNVVGFLVWSALDEGRSIAHLVELVRDQVLDPPPTVERDVIEFLEGAAKRNLVLVSEAQP